MSAVAVRFGCNDLFDVPGAISETFRAHVPVEHVAQAQSEYVATLVREPGRRDGECVGAGHHRAEMAIDGCSPRDGGVRATPMRDGA